MIPKKLQVDEISFVLLERGGKKPFQNSWQNKLIRYDSAELIEHIKNGGNYGVMGGGSKNLIVVDFDNDNLQGVLLPKLPKTFSVKTGSGKLHLYYFSNKSDSYKIFDEDMNTLLDVQGIGKQVVGAGSIHPNGNRYEVVDDIEISFIEYAELKALIMPFDRKPKKERKIYDKPLEYNHDDFLDFVKSRVFMDSVLASLGVDISKNPTTCPFHESKGGKCLSFNQELAHCFHCDGGWNIYSIVKQYKSCGFKEALEYIVHLGGLDDEYKENRKKYIDKIRLDSAHEILELKVAFLKLVKDEKISDASELIVKHILDNNYIYTIKNDNKTEIWIYRDGIYVPQGKSEIKAIMRKILEQWFNSYYYNLVLNKIEPDTFIEQELFFKITNVDEIPVQNGILNVWTRELKPFTPEKIFFNKLPIIYDPNASCPNIDKFLSEVLANVDDKKIFYEIAGCSLLKEYRYEKAFMFVGNGRNGKGKSLELMKRLFGPENCTSIPLSALTPDSFVISELFGKFINLAGDIGNKDLEDTSMFKSLTGRDLVSAKRKFLPSIIFENYAKFVFACNDLPTVYDTSRGFWDRWVLLEFPYTFVSQEEYDKALDKKNLKIRDENIINKIINDTELSGLLNKALNGLERINANKNFSTTNGTKEVKELWIKKSNSFMAFAMESIAEHYEGRIVKKELRKLYLKFCKLHGVGCKSDFVIKKTLQETFGATESKVTIGTYPNDNQEYVWEGVKWKWNL